MDIRERSYYYKQAVKEKQNRQWIPRFVRRFYHQHRQKVLIASMVGVGALMYEGFIRDIYYHFTMPADEYDEWVRKEKIRFERFAKYGEGIRIPFTKKTIDLESPEQVRFAELKNAHRMKVIQRQLTDFEKRLGFDPPVDVPDDD